MVLNAAVAPFLQGLNDDDEGSSHVVYLNNAAQARLRERVTAAGINAIRRQPWDAQHDKAVETQQQVRELFANIIQTESTNIAIHPSTAFAVTMAAENIFRLHQQKLRDSAAATTRLQEVPYKVILMEDEFNSAVYPWQDIVKRSHGTIKLEIVPYPNDDDDASSWTEAILRRLDESVLVACLTPLHWSNGAIIDLKRIGQQCRQLGTYLIVDSTQATGIYPCTVPEIQPDMLCCSVHKWLRGPSGTSLVYVHPCHHDSWQPLDQHARGRDLEGGDNWDAPQHTMDNQGYPTSFFSDARKFDAGGKADPIRLPMLAAALTDVATIDVAAAQAHLAILLMPLMDWCARRQYAVPPDHCHHLVGIRPSYMTVDEMLQVAAALATQEGIYIAVKCGSFRISPYLDNTPSDFELLIEALERHGCC